MPTIRNIVVKNMRRITLIMVIIILCFSAVIQLSGARRTSRQNALQIFSQVEQILDENFRELERVQKEYEARCLNHARTAAYILQHNPEAKNSVEELKKIAAYLEVDEIHIFDADGVIVAGTHPEHWGYSFESGEQIGFFKPLLENQSLELVQDITPNTAESKPVQYSALWSENRGFIVQVGMYPSNVLQATENLELSYIFSLLRTGVGYSLYAIDPNTEKIVGATVVSDVGKRISDVGFQADQLELDESFHAKLDGVSSHCLSKKIGENYIVWAAPTSDFYKSIAASEILLLAGLLLISMILVWAVTGTMNLAVIGQIKKINGNLRAIQHGDLKTKVDVSDSKEFLELSTHINSMVDSLLQSSEKLEMSEKIKSQKEELEQQHEQLEAAVEHAEAANLQICVKPQITKTGRIFVKEQKGNSKASRFVEKIFKPTE